MLGTADYRSGRPEIHDNPGSVCDNAGSDSLRIYSVSYESLGSVSGCTDRRRSNAHDRSAGRSRLQQRSPGFRRRQTVCFAGSCPWYKRHGGRAYRLQHMQRHCGGSRACIRQIQKRRRETSGAVYMCMGCILHIHTLAFSDEMMKISEECLFCVAEGRKAVV